LELCAKLQRFPEIARIVDPMLLPPLLDEVILRALQEDLAGGDLSAEACVPLDRRARARALAKSPLITCGGVVFRRVFELVDPTTVVHLDVPDGEPAQDRRCLWRVEGLARSLLQAERTALNFAQRMSGTATLARACVNALPAGSGTRVTDTRKTTPGLRALERYAVRTGGAHNHRKDNHIVAAGGIAAAVERARRHAPHTSRVEVEVASLDELEQALAAKVDIVMLDNFDDAMVSSAVARVSRETPRPLVEVSGGVTLERIGILGGLGVDVISVGALTHSARAADISLELELV
jgi:nicotinate-nucleotide pyrophosphorylase (carboxylating)